MARFSEAECSWLSSVRPSEKVHSAPVWHVWHEGRVYVVTQETAVKVRNIAQNPSVVITHPDPMEPIIIEGTAVLVVGMVEELRPSFQQKYEWDIATDDAYQAIIQITPTKIIAWQQGGKGSFRWQAE
jgi:hypothetical protein